MAVTIFLEGCISLDGRHVALPLSSCALLLVVSYSRPSSFHLVFVQMKTDGQSPFYVRIPRTGLISLCHDFRQASLLPKLISNVVLPATVDSAAGLVRSGLCVIIRHIIKTADSHMPEQRLSDLLGFRQGSLRMCAEVSGWTKLCEVELPSSISKLVHHIRLMRKTQEAMAAIELPVDLVRLEIHFEKPPKVHNDDRRRRKELSELRADLANPGKCAEVFQSARIEGSNLMMGRVTDLPHGQRKFSVKKEIAELDGFDSARIILKQCSEEKGLTKEQLCGLILNLSYLDIRLVHLYSEGVEMTIADLCLFSYLYYLLEALEFEVCHLEGHLPCVFAWLRHMVTLPHLESASILCGMDFRKLKHALNLDSKSAVQRNCVHFSKPPKHEITQDDMELSRRCRTKHKAIKPEVTDAMTKIKAGALLPLFLILRDMASQKEIQSVTGDIMAAQFQNQGIKPILGSHPRGNQVSLDWDTFPAYVHPQEGKIPAKRVARKRQQLENLVTAVLEVAHPGDIIVDFCSGGGHLGITIAHLLPECKVYLVENKEESLAKAQSRMADIKNIVLYQCNMDYFVGKFDIGVCLHACGSATDMVLHQCLQNSAAFVICPCCYGSIQNTHLLTYPRSQLFQDKNVTYKEFLTLGHAADQTEFNIALEQQGRQCMNLVDFDRAELAREAGYQVVLTSLQPLTCSPKNNLLIGQKHSSVLSQKPPKILEQ